MGQREVLTVHVFSVLSWTNHRNLFTGNIWKTKRDIAVFTFKSDGTFTLLVSMYLLCPDSFIFCDNFTFHANFCNSILLFPSPMYATRYICFQGNIRQMCVFLLTAGDKWNIKVKYQLKSQRGTILFKTQIFISRIKQELI